MKNPTFSLMPAIIFIILLTVFSWYNSNRNLNEDYSSYLKEGKDTPQRVGKSETPASLEKKYTLSEAASEADLVAQVLITGWLGETGAEAYPETIFSVKILKSYSKSDLKEITIIQSGGQASTYKDYPLFQKGDQLLLFLIKDNESSENTYRILGNFSTILYISREKNKTYVGKRFGDFDDTKIFLNYSSNALNELYKREKDISENVAGISHIYLLKDIENYINKTIK